MVDLLVFCHCLVNLRFVLQTGARPQQIPFIQICLLNPVGGEDVLQDLALGIYQLEEAGIGVLDHRKFRLVHFFGPANQLHDCFLGLEIIQVIVCPLVGLQRKASLECDPLVCLLELILI